MARSSPAHSRAARQRSWSREVRRRSRPGPSRRAGPSATAAAAPAGRAVHKGYSAVVAGLGYKTGVILKSGRKPDAVNSTARIVRELKPNNPKAIARGLVQAKRYARELQKTFGGVWTYIIDVYV